MASRYRKADPATSAKAGRVKGRLPKPSREAVARALRKTETLSFRLTPAEKQGLRVAASSVGMSISEYVLKCHEVISQVLRDQAPR